MFHELMKSWHKIYLRVKHQKRTPGDIDRRAPSRLFLDPSPLCRKQIATVAPVAGLSSAFEAVKTTK